MCIKLNVVTPACNLSTWGLRQEDCQEFEAGLGYMVSSRPAQRQRETSQNNSTLYLIYSCVGLFASSLGFSGLYYNISCDHLTVKTLSLSSFPACAAVFSPRNIGSLKSTQFPFSSPALLLMEWSEQQFALCLPCPCAEVSTLKQSVSWVKIQTFPG